MMNSELSSRELRERVDKLWTQFWTGGIANPLTVIEQITFLMFARLLDATEARNENRARRTNKSFRRIFAEDQQELRWSQFKNLPGDEMLALVRDKVFLHFRSVALEGAKFGEYMKDAQLLIVKPSLLVEAVNMIEALPLTEGDTKGDLYEYLLKKLTTAGINGQFRTPRHIIRMMVQLLDPKPTDRIADPACGTAGFLVAALEYLVEKHTSPEGVMIDPHTGEKIFTGDLLEPHREHIRASMFHGFDFDVTMLRIAAMNLLLHGVDAPDIHYQDTLSASFTDKFPESAENGFDIVLANPPFKGSLDFEDVHAGLLRKVKTKKTELLFLVLILRMLRMGGRSATIVPDGVLFGSSKAHVALREILVDENQLEAVISLPSGVFKPYAGVSTAILVFSKGGRTDNVFFYDVEADGFSLDDKRQKIDSDDLPVVIEKWRAWKSGKTDLSDRRQKAFTVAASDIRAKGYDLSLNQYREAVREVMKSDPPAEILGRMNSLEMEIQKDLVELGEML
jgi:type I restriction enzyme M protein